MSIEKQEEEKLLNEVREYNGLKLTLCVQTNAGRLGKYVLVIENPQEPDELVEVYLDKAGKTLDSARFQTKDCTRSQRSSEKIDQDKINEYLEQFFY